jgi:hypothetical protein
VVMTSFRGWRGGPLEGWHPLTPLKIMTLRHCEGAFFPG